MVISIGNSDLQDLHTKLFLVCWPAWGLTPSLADPTSYSQGSWVMWYRTGQLAGNNLQKKVRWDCLGLCNWRPVCSTCQSLLQRPPPSGHQSVTSRPRRAMVLAQQPLASEQKKSEHAKTVSHLRCQNHKRPKGPVS